jgi:hypothetical protein
MMYKATAGAVRVSLNGGYRRVDRTRAVGQKGTVAIVGPWTFERRLASGKRHSSLGFRPVQRMLFLTVVAFGRREGTALTPLAR